jgi:hypothetical protein
MLLTYHRVHQLATPFFEGPILIELPSLRMILLVLLLPYIKLLPYLVHHHHFDFVRLLDVPLLPPLFLELA